jgi:membrane associated rhomboid family serine protease
MWSITTWLIVINIAVFLLDGILAHAGETRFERMYGLTKQGFLTQWGYFSYSTAIQQGQVWRFLTFQFLHASPSHLLWNMVSLYFFGRIVEPMYGAGKFLGLYLVCGVAGTVAYTVLWAAGMFGDVGGGTELVGASAGIFGVLVVAAMLAPNVQFMFIFPPIPIRLRTLAWIMLGLAVYAVVFSGENAGGEASHLGGAAMGLIFVFNPQLLDLFTMRRRSRTRRRTSFSDWRNDPNH